MPVSAYVTFAVLSVLCVMAAQRLASAQQRKALPWMVAALSLGPFALIPLALMQKRGT